MFLELTLDLISVRVGHHQVHQHFLILPKVLLVLIGHLLGLVLRLLKVQRLYIYQLWLVLLLLLLDDTLHAERERWRLGEFLMDGCNHMGEGAFVSPALEDRSLVEEGVRLDVLVLDLAHDLDARLGHWEV